MDEQKEKKSCYTCAFLKNASIFTAGLLIGLVAGIVFSTV